MMKKLWPIIPVVLILIIVLSAMVVFLNNYEDPGITVIGSFGVLGNETNAGGYLPGVSGGIGPAIGSVCNAPSIHTLRKMSDGQAATYDCAGFMEYFGCDGCGLYYSDGGGEDLIGDSVALQVWKAEGGNGYIPSISSRFDAYRNKLKNDFSVIASGEGSNSFSGMINAAMSGIDGISYDPNKTYEENQQAADAIVTEFEKELFLQRTKENAVLYLQNIENEDPLDDKSPLKDGIERILAALDAIAAEAEKQNAVAAIRKKQTEELTAAKENAKTIITEESEKDPLLDVYSVTNGKQNIDSAKTKAEVETAKKHAIDAIRSVRNSELAAAKASAKKAIEDENVKDPLLDDTALINGNRLVDAAETKADVLTVKLIAVNAVRDAQTAELASSKEKAKNELSAENAKDSLIDETPLSNGYVSIDRAETKADVTWAKKNALAMISSTQKKELETAKANAKALLAEENGKDPLADDFALVYGNYHIETAVNKAEVENEKQSAADSIHNSQSEELAAAKAAARRTVSDENLRDPLFDGYAVSAADRNIGLAETKAEVETAKENALTEIRRMQANELAQVKADAKKTIVFENLKTSLYGGQYFAAGNYIVDRAETKADVEVAKQKVMTAMRDSQTTAIDDVLTSETEDHYFGANALRSFGNRLMFVLERVVFVIAVFALIFILVSRRRKRVTEI